MRLQDVHIEVPLMSGLTQLGISEHRECCGRPLALYHRSEYLFSRESNFRYIRNSSTIQENLYMRNIFQLRYPSRFGIWTFSLLFHCTMALLSHSQVGHEQLPSPTVPLSADVPPSTIWQANLDVFCRS